MDEKIIPITLTTQKEAKRSINAILPAKAMGTPKTTNNPVSESSIDPIPPGRTDKIPIKLAKKNIIIIDKKLI